MKPVYLKAFAHFTLLLSIFACLLTLAAAIVNAQAGNRWWTLILCACEISNVYATISIVKYLQEQIKS